MAIARISPTVLDIAAHQDAVTGPQDGALASFVGTVRDHSPDAAGQVQRLEYVAHPAAEEVLEQLAAQVSARHDGVTIAVSHRTGDLDVGEVAIVACAASAHRAAAFDACQDVVETVKAELPMWKKQVLVDGSHTWVGAL
ncbi:molybdenum cofactor biosynthesis protein MoaE [Ruania alba]|uniref:Molybdopterin synthase subunit MoaE n=1 Tax=Ruania alba TaxID=648782 RepID=A0A1H5MWI6_9MICO|nr:molybdenum cofactor biosynthesis protein MoaE [Ruania alba]SEE93097.1 molybdopterin synthase subunit MoaE [Ruania alba]